MHRLQKSLIILLPALLVLLNSCAHIVKPTGGPKDKDGPKIIGTIPPPQVLNYVGDEIVIYFDEFIKPGNYKKEVFVSPVMPIEPSVVVKNKRMSIKFNAPLLDSTTYVITLGTGIKDFNEGNKMDKPFVYAFSTGDQLDSLEIKGKVTSPWTGAGEKGMKVLLFLADEIEGNEILGLKPTYAIETDDDGEFNFQYLREAEFKIFAVMDEDNDYAYSNVRERIAITANPIINLADSADLVRTIEMFSYVEDKESPRVKSARWANDYTIRVEFGEAIRDSFGEVGLNVSLLDSVAGERLPVTQRRYNYKNNSILYVTSPFPRDRDLKLTLENMMDTLGTYSDTTLYLAYDLKSKGDEGIWFQKPILEPGTNHIVVKALFPLPEGMDSSHVKLLDSLKNPIPLRIRTDGLTLYLEAADSVDTSLPDTLLFYASIPLPDGKSLDTTIGFPIQFTDPESFGSLSGTIMADTLDSNATFVMLLLSRRKKETVIVERIKGPGPFSLPYLAPGPYTIKLIRDTDRNGYLSPGSLEPYFMPEEVIVDPGKVEVKENWEVKDYNVFPYKPKGGKKKRRIEEGDDTGDGEDENDEGNNDNGDGDDD